MSRRDAVSCVQLLVVAPRSLVTYTLVLWSQTHTHTHTHSLLEVVLTQLLAAQHGCSHASTVRAAPTLAHVCPQELCIPSDGGCDCQATSSSARAGWQPGMVTLTDPAGDLEMGDVTVEIRVRAGGPPAPPAPGTCSGAAAVAATAAAIAAGAGPWPLSPGKALDLMAAAGFGGSGRAWPLALEEACAGAEPSRAEEDGSAEALDTSDRSVVVVVVGQQQQQQQQALPPAISDDPDDGLCTICCDRQASCVFMECGHGGYCWRCAHLLYIRPPNECPVCRARIELVLEVSNPSVPLGASAPVLQPGADVRRPIPAVLGCLPCSGGPRVLPAGSGGGSRGGAPPSGGNVR